MSCIRTRAFAHLFFGPTRPSKCLFTTYLLVAGVCIDNELFVDAAGYHCHDWVGYVCDWSSFNQQQISDLHRNCRVACNLCPATSAPTPTPTLLPSTFSGANAIVIFAYSLAIRRVVSSCSSCHHHQTRYHVSLVLISYFRNHLYFARARRFVSSCCCGRTDSKPDTDSHHNSNTSSHSIPDRSAVRC